MIGIVIGVLVYCSAFTMAGELQIESSTYLPLKTAFNSNISRFLVKFDLTGIPQNANIDLAYIRFNANIDTTISTPLNLAVYPVTESWTASETPVINGEIAFTDSLSVLGISGKKGPQEIELVVTELVQAWVDGNLVNNGIVIMGLENSESELDVYTDKPGVIASVTVLYSGGAIEKE
jgi:hypothetical protein